MQPLYPWKTAAVLAHPMQKQKMMQNQTAPQQRGAGPGNSEWLYPLVMSSPSVMKRAEPRLCCLNQREKRVWCTASSPDLGQEFSKASLCILCLWGLSGNLCCDHWWIQEHLFLFGAGDTWMIRKTHKHLLGNLASFFQRGGEIWPFQICPICGSCGLKALVHL